MSCCRCNCDPCACSGGNIPAIPIVPIPAPPLSNCSVQQNPCEVPSEDPCAEQAPRLFEQIDPIVVPPVDSSITVSVCDVDNWLLNCCVVIKDDTNVVSLRIGGASTANNTLELFNDGFVDNPLPGTVFSDPTYMFFSGICPLIEADPADCVDVNVLVEEAFSAPDEFSTALMKINDCTTAVVGQEFFVSGLGCVLVQDIPVNTPMATWEISVVDYLPGVTAGTIVPSGAFIVPANDCFGGVVTDDSLTGVGTNADPLSVAMQPSWFVCHELSVGITTMPDRHYVCGLPPGPANHPLFVAPDAPPSPVPLSHVIHDNFAGVDLPNNGYIIPKDGEYFIHMYVQTSEGGADGDYTTLLAINDNEIIMDSSTAGNLDVVTTDRFDTHLLINANVRLSAGDVVKGYVYFDAGAGIVQTALDVEVVFFGGFYVNP